MMNKSCIVYSILCFVLLSQKIILVDIYIKFLVKKTVSALVKKEYFNEVKLINYPGF